MWPFSSNDDDRGQGESSGGFLSGLLTAVKWVAIAAAAVLSLGAVFAFSPAAKLAVDKLTGSKKEGDGNGLGSWFEGIFTSAKDKVTDLFTKKPTPENAAELNTIATPDGKKYKVLEESANLAKSTPSVNPQAYKETTDLDNILEKLNSGNTTDPKFKLEKTSVLKEKRKELMAYGEAVVAWNERVAAHKKSADFVSELEPPVIALTLPPLTDRLAAHGRAKHKENWDKMSPLERIKTLEAEFDKAVKEPPKIKEYSVDILWTRTLRDMATAGWTKITPENVGAIIDTNHHDSMSRWVGLNEAQETRIHELAARLMKDKRYEEAVIVAERGMKVFQYAADNPKLVPAGDLQYGPIYRKAIEDFKEIKEYASVMRDKHELSPILNGASAAIIAAAEEAPGKLAEYEQRIADAKSGKLKLSAPAPKAANAAEAGSNRAAGGTEHPSTNFALLTDNNLPLGGLFGGPLASFNDLSISSTPNPALAAALAKGTSNDASSIKEGFVNVAAASPPAAAANAAMRGGEGISK